MSVQTLRRATSPIAAPARRLRLLPSPRPRRRAPRRGLFIVVLVSVLIFGLVSLLLLNTTLAQQAFRLHDLGRQASVLADSEAQLTVQVDELTQPQALAAAAVSLGMVPGCDPGFVREDGLIMGTSTKVTGVRHGSVLVVPPGPKAEVSAAATVCPGTPAKIAQQLAAKAAADKAAADKAAAEAAAGTTPTSTTPASTVAP